MKPPEVLARDRLLAYYKVMLDSLSLEYVNQVIYISDVSCLLGR